MDELNNEVRKLNNGKCRDTNKVFAEMIKQGGPQLKHALLYLYNGLIQPNAETPKQWKQTVMTVIHKSGDPQQPSNYRPIAIIPILYKLFARLLYCRLAPQLNAEQTSDQAGFRPNFSTLDHLFVFTCIEEKAHEYNLPVWLAALDFKKAFDTVEHHHVWTALETQGITTPYISLLKSLYTDQTGRVRTDVMSKQFNIERGTKQGDPLSSMLFNALLEHIMRPIKEKWSKRKYGIKLNDDDDSTLTNLRFADDILLTGTTLHQTREMLKDIKQAAENVGLHLHTDNTKV